MQLRRKLNSRGDTIVEVLIVIAVIGAVLGGAYTLVNSNVQNNQAAQERSYAVKLAETQLEQLKAYAAQSGVVLPAANSDFCMTSTTTVENNAANCTFRHDGTRAANERYATVILVDGSGNGFTVTVQWDGANGGRDQASIAYKVYQ